ncbi:MAG: 16S rRNA (adenine(1518)-N(6)/adenine(1519)-N(6)) -dimethyltransferase RsmA [Turneriella sp.]
MLHPSKLLKELGISPLRQLGQNFQVDVHSVENAAAHIPAGTEILEIGPGLGAWTEVFLARGHQMMLVEKDRTLAARLKEKYSGDARLQVHEGDILQCDLSSPEFCSATAAVGNLPFYATSEILLRLIVECPHITHALFGVQLEVAERIASGKGSSLAIALGAQGKLFIAGKISRNSFFPVPNVDAAILAFERNETLSRPRLRALLKAAFWGKRKALSTALRKNPFWAEQAETAAWYARLTAVPRSLQPLLAQRADELGVADFQRLYDYLESGEYLT